MTTGRSRHQCSESKTCERRARWREGFLPKRGNAKGRWLCNECATAIFDRAQQNAMERRNGNA